MERRLSPPTRSCKSSAAACSAFLIASYSSAVVTSMVITSIWFHVPVQRQTHKHVRLIGGVDLKTTGLQALRENPVAICLFVPFFGPSLPILVEGRRRRRIPRALDGSFGEPAPKQVFGREVFIRRGSHALWRIQSVSLPLQAPIDAPTQDRRPFGFQFL